MYDGRRKTDIRFKSEGYEQVYEYQACAFLGVDAWNVGVNAMARKGWELVNGGMAGTANCAYMRRPVKRAIDPDQEPDV